MKALVLGESQSPGTLAVVRELGRSGWLVGVGSYEPFGLAASSRWCFRRHNIPRPLGNLREFIEGINSAARAEGYEIVFSAGDAEVLAMSSHRQEILPIVPYGPDEGVRKGFDKLCLSQLAVKYGIHAPQTLPASDESLETFDMPIAVKSRLHWMPGVLNSQVRVEATLCKEKTSALSEAQRMRALGVDPLFQAYIPGKIMVLTILFDKIGSVISSMSQLELYEAPWRSNANFRTVTVQVDQDLLRRCKELLNEIQWFGLCCLQFQMTSAGIPFLIDFNGRAVRDAALASSCGMRGHDTWARLATGKPISNSEEFFVSEGYYYQDIEWDLRHTLLGRHKPNQFVSEIVQFLGYIGRSAHPVLSRDDLMPLISYLVNIVRRIFGRVSRMISFIPMLQRGKQ